MAAPQSASRPAPEPQPTLAAFEDVVALIQARRDIGLQMDVQRFVRPVSFRPGAIEFEPAPGAPSDLTRRLAARLKEWTGQTWLVATAGGGGAESAWERQKREEREARAQVEADPFVKSVLEAFPGAELLEVRHIGPAPGEAVETPEDDEADDE